MRSMGFLLFVLWIAQPAAAADILAVHQAGSTDHEKLSQAIAVANPGDTIHLADCIDEGEGVVCLRPKVWVLDESLVGKHGVTYTGQSRRGDSTLKMADFGPEDDWDAIRWRDILTFGHQPPSELPTVVKHLIFDGNRDRQGASPNPNCEAACPGDWTCVVNWCVSPTCDGCGPNEEDCPEDRTCVSEPKQEGLLLTALQDQQQQFVVENVNFRDHLWVGMLVWHGAEVEAKGLSSTNNLNAIQLGGHKGHVRLDLSGWGSVRDRVAFRGEIEGALRLSRDTVRARISDSKIIDPTSLAISFGPKACTGVGSEFLVEGVRTACDSDPACSPYVHLVPGFSNITVRESKIGGVGEGRDNKGLALWLQNVAGDVEVSNSQLGGYVHFHSVAAGFERVVDPILFENVTLSGLGKLADSFAIPGSGAARYAFYTNRNLNIYGPFRWFTLSNVDARAMQADRLLHLYGGGARVDRRTFRVNSLGLALGGDPDLYSSTVEMEVSPGVFEPTEVTEGFRLIEP